MMRVPTGPYWSAQVGSGVRRSRCLPTVTHFLPPAAGPVRQLPCDQVLPREPQLPWSTAFPTRVDVLGHRGPCVSQLVSDDQS
jgi:hypothetical protein